MLGLWERTIISDLLWEISGEAANRPLGGPSWTWLSHSRQAIRDPPQWSWFNRETNELEPRLESFDAQWRGSPFTSKLASSSLRLSGVIRTFEITDSQWEYIFHVAHPNHSHVTGEVSCTLDDGSEISDGLNITCLFFFYATEHDDIDGPNGELIFQSRRLEYFLIISPHTSSNRSGLDPTLLSDSDPASENVKPVAYQRLGVGYFELQLVPKNTWARISTQRYNNTSLPNPPLMFDGAERITIELV